MFQGKHKIHVILQTPSSRLSTGMHKHVCFQLLKVKFKMFPPAFAACRESMFKLRCFFAYMGLAAFFIHTLATTPHIKTCHHVSCRPLISSLQDDIRCHMCHRLTSVISLLREPLGTHMERFVDQQSTCFVLHVDFQ